MRPILPNEPGRPDALFLPTEEMSRRNGLLYVVSMCIFMFAAPVVYVGVVQAALADKLGASAMVANLPASTYLLGAFAPPCCRGWSRTGSSGPPPWSPAP